MVAERFDDIDTVLKFERRIASTAAANIWLCSRDTERVVVKELAIKRVANPAHVFNERDVLQLLTDCGFPRSPKLIGTAKSKDSVFIVMELVDGAPLHLHLPRAGFSERIAKRYFAETLSILEFLHSNRIVYRDLKLSNILVRRSDGRLCLCDFGLSKTLTNDRTNSVCGTLHAMAPEIKSGAGHSFDVDYWSLGILLFELLEGTAPFGYSNVSEERVLESPGSVLFSVGKHSEESKDLISQLLTVDPGQRLTSFELIRQHAFFSDCNEDWWLRCRFDSVGVPDSDVPDFDSEIGREFIYGPPPDKWADF